MRSLFILLLFTSGCSLLESPRDISLTDSGPILAHDAGSPSDAGPSEEPRCSKDPQRMRDKASCAGDENCPCGSYCWLGQCHFECLDGERPCAEDQRCGLYGRCVAAEDSEEIPELEVPEAGKLVISRSWLQVLDRDQEPVVKLSAEGAAVGKVRVTARRALQSTLLDEQRALADEHVEVSCSEFGDDFAAECSFSNIEPEAPQKIRVRAAGSVESADRVADQWTVQVHWPRGQRVITMKLIAVPEAPAQVDGLYEGRYELRSSDGAEILSLPVRAEVLAGEDGNVLRLIDEAKVLGGLNHADDVWGRWDEESASLTPFALLQSGSDAGDYQAHLQHAGAMAVTSGGTLIANFDVAVAGIAPRDDASFRFQELGRYGVQNMRAVLTLARSDDLPDEAVIRSLEAQAGGRTGSLDALADPSTYWGNRGSWGANLGWKSAAQSLSAVSLSRRINGNTWTAFYNPEIIDYISLPEDSKSLTACETDFDGDRRSHPNYLELLCRSSAYPIRSIRLCEDVAEERAAIGCTDMQTAMHCNGRPCLFKCLKQMGSGPLLNADKANHCAQRYMCYSPPPADAVFSTASNGLSATMNRVSGDLTCAGDEPAESALGFLSNPDRIVEEQLTSSQLFGACIRDLNREAPSVERDGDGLRSLFQSEGCIDLGRYFNALRWSSWAARDRIGHPERDARDGEEGAHSLYLRLVGAWAQLHQYLAVEGLQTHLFNRSLPENDELLATESINLTALTEQLARGMEMMTNTYFVGGLIGVPADVLAVPDYRARLHVDFDSSESWHRQSTGLPVFMLESLGSYLEVVHAQMLEAWEGDGDLDGSAAPASLALRQSVAIESLARQLWTKASQQDLTWNLEMQRALRNTRNWRQKLMTLRQSMVRGANALGVSEDDLAFVYDPELELGRLNSVSEHLLGGYVGRQIDFATTKYSLAADAWTSLRTGVVQQRNFEAQQAERLSKIKAAYGSQFTELCGDQLVTSSALEWARDLSDPMLCGLDNTNDDCELDKSAVYDLVTPDHLRGRLAQMHWYRRLHNPAANFVHDGLASLVELATFTGEHAEVSDLLRTDFSAEQLGRFAEGLYLGTVGVERSEQKALQARGLAEAFLPNAQPMPTLSDLPNSPLENTSCYVGAVGSAMSASRMSGLALKEAQANAQGFVDSYRHAASSCQILVRQHDTEQRINAVYTGLMIGLTAAQTALQVAGELTDVDAIGLFTSGGAKGVSAGAKAGAAALGGVMASLTLAHNNVMTNIANNFEEIRCFHDAEMHLI
ncbi:MAG: hypothetical protein OSB21_05135, partial [Myxococcota bacterium]|nr:hypothetical protein [Myxococcota bacterium]